MVDAEAKSGARRRRSGCRCWRAATCKLGDDAGYAYALDKLLAYYPRKEYWADAIRRVESKAGLLGSPALDVLRLRHATGTLGGTRSYAAMTQLAMAAALPAEAKRISDEGFASGALGTGADADAAEAAARRRGEAGGRRREAAPAKRQGRRARRRTASRSSTSASRT